MWVEKHGPGYRIRDRVGGQKVTIDDGYPTKSTAKTAMIQYQADALRGESLVPRGGRVLLSELLDAWEESYLAGLKPTAAHSEGGRLRNHIRALLGHLTLDDIDPLVVQRWVGQLSAGKASPHDPARFKRRPLAPKTVRSCHALLHKVMAVAVRQRYIRANPSDGTELPAKVHREMRFLTDPEIGRLLAHTPAHWRPLVMLLIATGLRWGEAIALRIQDVDLLAKPAKLVVVRHMHELSGTGAIHFGAPKSEKSRRTVSFTVKIALALTALWSGRGRDDLLFSAPRGGPVRTRNFRRGWVKWCKAAGLEGLRIHDLRHTHAGILISDGRSLVAVQRRLGHSSIAVTVDLYGHLREEVDEGILAAIDAALADVDLDALAAEVDAELADETADIA